ncbi:hydrolase [soil metagenome]
MLLDPAQCQLVLVDYQARLMPAIFESEFVTANAVRLGEFARLFRVPAFGTEQSPDKLGSNEPQLRALCQRTLSKQHFSAAADGLVDWLRPAPAPAPPPEGEGARRIPKQLKRKPAEVPERNCIVIAGCEAHICLLQTALELLDEEFDVVVVTDACSSRTERNRDAAFDRLAGAGADLVTTEMVGFEWLRSADHRAFKDVQALIVQK